MAQRGVRIKDLRKFKFVSDPQISPDGEEVAFVLSTIDYKEDRYDRHIWMADTGSGTLSQFTHGTESDTHPRWSPDGNKILFLSTRKPEAKKPDLYVIPRDGGEANLVAEAQQGIRSPIWGPDSKTILYTTKVWTVEEPDSDVKRITRIRYKLNGEGCFEGRRSHLFTVRLRGKPRRLTEGEYDVEAASWSPDGTMISFVTNMEPGADTSRVKDVFSVPSKGGEIVKLTRGGHSISAVSWSPDGKLIAFIGHDQPEELAVDLDMWIMEPDGGGMVNLTDGFDRSLSMGIGSDLRVSTPDAGPVWCYTGGSLYFATADTPHRNVYKVDIEGSVREVVTGSVVDGFSLSRDDSVMAFNALSSTRPAELYIKRGHRDPVRVSRFNDRLLGGAAFVEPEHFTFKNRLGREVDGWLIRPFDWREGESYPVVLEMHGGPRSVYGNAPFHEFQILAAEGYAVIYTNPRGSAGYDEDYAQAVMRHYGEVDYEDLMDFTDEALRRFNWLDEDRMGLTGGSYGGYTTNWIICHTDRFQAAVTFRSICNWVSKFGVSDIGYMQPESISGRETYWEEDMVEQLKHSPLYYVDRVKTPCLIVHSEQDLRCPMEQAEQWFTALKLNEVPTELVRFPEENHDLSRSGKPRHREERLRLMVRWFNNYLK